MPTASTERIEDKRADLLVGYAKAIELIRQGIDNYAKAFIPDFHFLDHKVSTFWRCKDSPIGLCVFNLNKRGYAVDCRYCHQPEERK